MDMHLNLLSVSPSNSATLPVDEVDQLIEQLQTFCLFAEPSYSTEEQVGRQRVVNNIYNNIQYIMNVISIVRAEQVDVLEQDGTFYLPQRSLVPSSLVTADGYSSMSSLEEQVQIFSVKQYFLLYTSILVVAASTVRSYPRKNSIPGRTPGTKGAEQDRIISFHADIYIHFEGRQTIYSDNQIYTVFAICIASERLESL